MKTIFLIDDDGDDRDIFQTALLSLEAQTAYLEAKDGEEALAIIAQPGFTPPDVFFVDLNMPKIGGLEFILAMKKLPGYAAIKTYMYTTSSSHHEKEKCMQAGADGFIIKHNSYDDLCRELEMLI